MTSNCVLFRIVVTIVIVGVVVVVGTLPECVADNCVIIIRC